MEIKYLKLIKFITEEGSIAESAQKLFLTPSALSHQLKEVEKMLGYKVFFRSRNNWTLSPEGEELYKMACDIVESLEKGFKSIKKLQAGSSGNISISTECYSLYQGLPSFLQQMKLLYPDININLNIEATHKPIEKLLSKEIDIALVSTKNDNDSLKYIKICSEEIFAILHKEHASSQCEYLSADHFASIHLIIHSYPLETVFIHEHFLKPNNIAPSKISAIPLTELALEMVQANMGVFCLPKSSLRSLNYSQDLILKKIGPNGLHKKQYIAIRKEDSDKKYFHDFTFSFKDHFQNHHEI
ncbi:LysR family transcriptional regulator [Aureibacter tunicatorum]|uniref:LysR family transcriptional regulator for metE and metH n=1 Tax=Aureibacter tunicatorum TaxID=866807 RepID=A0AAE3XGV3_9BACT|nr:LysR substrate-binding domain-containing protein [Aureibacter tunicatorum]MDR6237366.1 LysR family transcriptional regulator for metE and metH [Aureibacter tunicatorum]BDD06357.1 XRE family transcriptional regulator [Aureibacter tunicatorum]